MIKYKCIKNGVIQNEWTSDYAGADYYEDCFGKKDRWVVVDQFSDEDITKAIESREIDDPILGKVTEYHFAADYVIEQEDVTAQITLEQKKKQAQEAQAKGAEIIAYVWAINDSKAMTIEQIQAFVQDVQLQQIERLLWMGALQTAKSVIEAYNNPFYTAEEKAAILAMF